MSEHLVDCPGCGFQFDVRKHPEYRRLEEALREIAFTSTSMPAAYNDPDGWERQLGRFELGKCISIAARAIGNAISTGNCRMQERSDMDHHDWSDKDKGPAE